MGDASSSSRGLSTRSTVAACGWFPARLTVKLPSSEDGGTGASGSMAGTREARPRRAAGTSARLNFPLASPSVKEFSPRVTGAVASRENSVPSIVPRAATADCSAVRVASRLSSGAFQSCQTRSSNSKRTVPFAALGSGRIWSSSMASEVSVAVAGISRPKRFAVSPTCSSPSRRSILAVANPGALVTTNTASSRCSSASTDGSPFAGSGTTSSRTLTPGNGSIRPTDSWSRLQTMADCCAGHSRPVASVSAPSSNKSSSPPARWEIRLGARARTGLPSRVAARLMFSRSNSSGTTRPRAERRVSTIFFKSSGGFSSGDFSKPSRRSACTPFVVRPSNCPRMSPLHR